jgi:hypothetical protein
MTFTPQQSFMLGTLAAGFAALANLEVDGSGEYVAPHPTYIPYSKQNALVDGRVRGGGWATLDWTFSICTQVQRDWLRAFCTEQSSEVMLRTSVMDSAEQYLYFTGVMVWPTLKEEHDAGRRPNLVIHFQRLVVYTPPS